MGVHLKDAPGFYYGRHSLFQGTRLEPNDRTKPAWHRKGTLAEVVSQSGQGKPFTGTVGAFAERCAVYPGSALKQRERLLRQ